MRQHIKCCDFVWAKSNSVVLSSTQCPNSMLHMSANGKMNTKNGRQLGHEQSMSRLLLSVSWGMGGTVEDLCKHPCTMMHTSSQPVSPVWTPLSFLVILKTGLCLLQRGPEYTRRFTSNSDWKKKKLYTFIHTNQLLFHVLPAWWTWMGWPSALLPSPQSSGVNKTHNKTVTHTAIILAKDSYSFAVYFLNAIRFVVHGPQICDFSSHLGLWDSHLRAWAPCCILHVLAVGDGVVHILVVNEGLQINKWYQQKQTINLHHTLHTSSLGLGGTAGVGAVEVLSLLNIFMLKTTRWDKKSKIKANRHM